jgi:hypothetical protein
MRQLLACTVVDAGHRQGHSYHRTLQRMFGLRLLHVFESPLHEDNVTVAIGFPV